jgi:hypothetical protein
LFIDFNIISCYNEFVKRILHGQGGVGTDYSNITMSRKQAQQICFAIIADIENYCEEHQAEFEEFVKTEALKEERKM